MPFVSDKQRRYLWSQKPEVAKKFAEHKEGGGAIPPKGRGVFSDEAIDWHNAKLAGLRHVGYADDPDSIVEDVWTNPDGPAIFIDETVPKPKSYYDLATYRDIAEREYYADKERARILHANQMIKDAVDANRSGPTVDDVDWQKASREWQQKKGNINRTSKEEQEANRKKFGFADGGPIGGNSMHVKKVTQKDRYGNTMSYEFEVPEKGIDTTRLMEKQMDMMMEVPAMMDIPDMDMSMSMGVDHPGEPMGSDTVPAWLTPGEFVVNAEAMRDPQNAAMVEAINDEGREIQRMQGGSIPTYHDGGIIPAPGVSNPETDLGFPFPQRMDNGGPVAPIPPWSQVPEGTEELLHEREGYRPDVYLDSLGKPTVGYGHLLDDSYKDKVGTQPYSEAELKAFFDKDVQAAQSGAVKNIGRETWSKLNPAQQRALTSMAFQLGEAGQKKFGNMIKAIQAGDHERVAIEALTGSKPGTKSKWLKQTPKRAFDLAEAFHPGVSAAYKADGGVVYADDGGWFDWLKGTGQVARPISDGWTDESYTPEPVVPEMTEADIPLEAFGGEGDEVPQLEEDRMNAALANFKDKIANPTVPNLGGSTAYPELTADNQVAGAVTTPEEVAEVQMEEALTAVEEGNVEKAKQAATTAAHASDNAEKQAASGAMHEAQAAAEVAQTEADELNKKAAAAKAAGLNEKAAELTADAAAAQQAADEAMGVAAGKAAEFDALYNKDKKPESNAEKGEKAGSIADQAAATEQAAGGETTGPGNDQPGDNKPADEVIGAGEGAPDGEKKQAESMLKGIFGDLFDKDELKRMGIMYLGSRLLGYSHGGSLQWAAKQYVGRVDNKVATRDAHLNKLIQDGKYTSASIAEYKKTLDPSVLRQPGAVPEASGEFKTFYGPGGKQQRAQKFKVGDQTVWQTADGRVVDANWSEDASVIKGTPEYGKRIKDDSKVYSDMLEGLRKGFGTIPGGRDQADTYKTELTPAVDGHKIAKWSLDNNVPPEYMGSIVENAYHSAIEHSKVTGEKVRDLTPFLEEQYVVAQVGDSGLFKGISGTNVSKLMQSVQGAAQKKGQSLTTTQIMQGYRAAWNNLSDEQRKQWNRKATKEENGFMKFVQNDVANSL